MKENMIFRPVTWPKLLLRILVISSLIYRKMCLGGLIGLI